MTEHNQKQLGSEEGAGQGLPGCGRECPQGAAGALVCEVEIDLEKKNSELVAIEQAIAAAKDKHNAFLKELGLQPLP
jgi:hypothetical protein